MSLLLYTEQYLLICRMDELRSTISQNGRVVIPVILRKRLQLHPGDEVVFTMDEGGIRLTSQKQALEDIQKLFMTHCTDTVSVSEELISMRRDEARKE